MARRKPNRTQVKAGPYDDLKNVNWWVIVAAVIVVGSAALISRSQRVLPGSPLYVDPNPPTAVAEEAEAPSAIPTAAGPVNTLQWDAPPEFTIDPETTDYRAIIKLPDGDVTIDLFEVESPITVNNFVFLANQGFYDNVTFHRVIENFMAQGGDPTGTGSGGPGYQFEDEVDNGLAFDRPGLLAMANAGPGTNGSQFFITTAITDWLTGAHTIFGEVIEGYELVEAIPLRDPFTATSPGLAMQTIEIVEVPKQ